MDKTWYLDSFNGLLNPISAIRTMCDSIRTNARRDGMGAIEDSGRKLYDLCNDMEHQIHATINLMNFSKDHGITSSTVYSDSFDEMVQKDFTYKGNKYTWNDSDCVYYNDNGDEEDFFMEIPEGAITSAKKPIKSSHDRETLKKVIRAYLDKMGYKDVEGGVDAAADYILQNEDYYSDYDLHSKVKQWFKETKENYPETLIKASKTIKSGYYDTTEHPEGGGTCDNCHEEVMPGDGYESDFESSREMALEGIIDAFKLGNIDTHDYFAKQQLIDFLDMEDEDELEDAISEICNMAFEGKGYQCPTCAQMNLGIAAKAWVEDNYDLDNEIESSAIKSAKSEFGYDAHETMTFDEFKNFVKSVVEPVEMSDYKSAYFVILNNEEDCKKLQQRLDNTYGVGCTYYPLQDPYNEHHGKWQLMA